MAPQHKVAIRLSAEQRGEKVAHTGTPSAAARRRVPTQLKADADGPDARTDERIAQPATA